MSGYALYVYSAWLIAYSAMGMCVLRDHARLAALKKKVIHDQ